MRTGDGTIANGGQVLIEPVSVGWTCSGFEDTPSQDLLKDASYAWVTGDPHAERRLHADPDEAGRLPRREPVVRVTQLVSIVKQVVDPSARSSRPDVHGDVLVQSTAPTPR